MTFIVFQPLPNYALTACANGWSQFKMPVSVSESDSDKFECLELSLSTTPGQHDQLNDILFSFIPIRLLVKVRSRSPS